MQTVRAGWVTRCERIWVLPPFQKEWAKRQRETLLLRQLDECVDQLFRDPTQPGLNLETLGNTGAQPIFSARISLSNRLILTPLGRTELGLLYFDAHDDAYRWVNRHRQTLPTMLARMAEVARDTPLGAALTGIPAVRADEDEPLALASAAQFRQMVDEGVARYLTFLDDEQRRIAQWPGGGLLLVKGGAGTGKTAVALHRLLYLAQQPPLLGTDRVLYLCYTNLLAQVARELLAALCH